MDIGAIRFYNRGDFMIGGSLSSGWGMKYRRSAFCALLLFGVPSQAYSQEPITIRKGDVLRVAVWREPQLSGDFAVSYNGTVSHPFFREIVVGDRQMAEIEAEFRKVLSQLTTSPQFVIEPLIRISVGGEVRTPSLYTVSPLTTIAQAVAISGGITDRCNLSRVRMLRGNEQITVDLTSPTDGLAQTTVKSGDQIYVDRRVNFFRDYVVPASSILAAAAAIVNIIVQNN